MPDEVDEHYAAIHGQIWAYAPQNADVIRRQYLAAGGYRRAAAGGTLSNMNELLDRSRAIDCRTLIVYGYQDYEPITQAFLLKDYIRDTTVQFVNESSHFPWIDQGVVFFELMRNFLCDE